MQPIIIRGLTFRDRSTAVSLSGSDHLVENCIFINSGIRLNKAGNATISNVTITQGSTGITATSSNFTVQDSQFIGLAIPSGVGSALIMYDAGEGVVRNSLFSGNSAQYGGVIRVSATTGYTASLSLFSCQFLNNQATSTGGVFDSGSRVTINIYNSLFQGNTAADRGGIFNSLGSLITIVNSEFYYNYGLNSANGLHSGGGIGYFQGGSIYVSSSNFSHNGVVTSSDKGGAFYLSAAYISVTSSSFTNNSATNGGAISCIYNAYFDITNSEFRDNTGAAIYVIEGAAAQSSTISGSVFERNTGRTGAGALNFVNAVNITVTNSTFSSNIGYGSGGAISMNRALTVSSCIFFNNSATNAGAVWASSGSTLTNCTFDSNSATSGSGGAVTGNFDFIKDSRYVLIPYKF